MIALRGRAPRFIVLLAVLGLALAAALAPRPSRADDGAPEIVVATKETPPFAMKDANGAWSGLSIGLWKQLADGLGLKYRFIERPTAEAVIDAVAKGEADAGISALTVTAARIGKVDFSASYFSTGVGVAMRAGESRFASIVALLLSARFLSAIAALVALSVVVGTIVWLVERRQTSHFQGGHKGLGAGIWWSAVAMVQAGAGQNAPATLAGRILAVVWMIASIVTIAIFTAGLTSTFTQRELKGAVQTTGDLRALSVGAPAGTSVIGFLNRERVQHTEFPSPADGLKALTEGRIEAFVYDKPLLAWTVRRNFPETLRVLEPTLNRQIYAIALPKGSALREKLNAPLLGIVESDEWRQTLFETLGSTDGN